MLKVKEFFKKNLKKVTRWNAELFLLGLLLAPIIAFALWIIKNQSVGNMIFANQALLLGAVVGILAILVWILGTSVIVINLLRDILHHLKVITELKAKIGPNARND